MSDDRIVVETPRLFLREFRDDDVAFIARLLNTDGFRRYIGDRGVRDEATALIYLHAGPQASYAKHGHGLYGVARRDDGALIGMCGVLRRDTLDAPDLGFAFLPEVARQGYALEAARGALRHARETVGLDRIAAITAPDNDDSIRLLGKLGFRFVGMIHVGGAAEPSRYFVQDPDDAALAQDGATPTPPATS